MEYPEYRASNVTVGPLTLTGDTVPCPRDNTALLTLQLSNHFYNNVDEQFIKSI